MEEIPCRQIVRGHVLSTLMFSALRLFTCNGTLNLQFVDPLQQRDWMRNARVIQEPYPADPVGIFKIVEEFRIPEQRDISALVEYPDRLFAI